MTFRLLSTAIALAVSAHAQNSQAVSFEQSYQLLEKRIEQLKAKGEKISDQSLKELDALACADEPSAHGAQARARQKDARNKRPRGDH